MDEELEKLVSNQEAKFRKVFNDWVKEKSSEETLRQLQTFLELGQVEQALDLMTDSQNVWPLIFLSVYVSAGVFETIRVSDAVGKFTFNPLNTTFYQSQAQSFSSFMGYTQRETIRQIIYREYSSRKSWPEIARIVAQNIGLSSRQQDQLLKYENLLRQEGIEDDKLERMLATKRRILIKQRAAFIAREEVDTLVAQARDDAARQGALAAGVDFLTVEKEWLSRRDSRVRPTHQHGSLDGQRKPIDQPFISSSGARLMFPRDRSLGAGDREVRGCRCRSQYHFPKS